MRCKGSNQSLPHGSDGSPCLGDLRQHRALPLVGVAATSHAHVPERGRPTTSDVTLLICTSIHPPTVMIPLVAHTRVEEIRAFTFRRYAGKSLWWHDEIDHFAHAESIAIYQVLRKENDDTEGRELVSQSFAPRISCVAVDELNDNPRCRQSAMRHHRHCPLQFLHFGPLLLIDVDCTQ